ncbi:hypothetical protein DNH61_09320 [Paenibacillus sambharensis]|uniref:DUF2382 domain-containing protein n=1 Tax=Paenibacillus sambharensis TaxID=1803190 RepID=A0A2W1LNP6_9BACL|nr:YsnF/AvaK domain-containing protein [Paenibacillus sambharensis]PZD96104.1 hypothetical protein DNH61_09320 [Paenibacillus sambharensis]
MKIKLIRMVMGAAAGCLLGVLAAYFVPVVTLTNGLWFGLLAGAAGAVFMTWNLQAMERQRKREQADAPGQTRPANASTSNREEPAAALQLKKEVLDISKEQVATGEVTIHREVVEEDKTVTVPTRREEVVIEVHNHDVDAPERSRSETLRIPVKEERVDVHTYPVALEEVDVHTRRVRDIKPVTAKLKREEADMESIGNPVVMEEEPAQETRT